MAGQENLLNRIVTLVCGLDDDALTAIASKGLLRRARKEIEKGTAISHAETTDVHVAIAVGEFRVSITAAGPADSRCTCPAPGCCQHILAACLQLPSLVETDAPESTTTEETPVDNNEWLKLTENALRKWAGAADFRKGCRLVADQLREVKGARIFFRTDVECHLIPGAGLDGVITNAAAKMKQAYVVAAVLSWRAANGVELPVDHQTTDTPAVKTDALAEIRELIEELIELGLNHLSDSAIRRLQTLAVQCRADRLYRPAAELENCATDVGQLLARHASASSARLFDRLSRLYALAASIQAHGPMATRTLTGTARSVYESGGELNLIGMGAYPWKTDSGYQGITALFWSPADQLFFSWSDVRPENTTDGFTPKKRYSEEAPWAGGGSLSRLTSSVFTLNSPRINEQRRLGTGEACRVEKLQHGLAASDLPDPAVNWESLLQQHAAARAMGLQRSVPLDDLVLLRPTLWGKPTFDEIEQQLIISVQDDQDEHLNLILPYTGLSEDPIRHLEKYPFRNTKTTLLAYLRRKPVEHLSPVALFEPEKEGIKLDNILFAEVPAKVGRLLRKMFLRKLPVSLLPSQPELSVADESDDLSPVAQFLSPLDELLVHQSESGSHRPVEREDWQKIRDRIDASGLTQLASVTSRIAAQASPDPSHLLTCRYLQLLHLEA